jgi:hypothetical protein
VLLFGFCCFEPFLAGLVVDGALGLGVHVGGAHCCYFQLLFGVKREQGRMMLWMGMDADDDA